MLYVEVSANELRNKTELKLIVNEGWASLGKDFEIIDKDFKTISAQQKTTTFQIKIIGDEEKEGTESMVIIIEGTYESTVVKHKLILEIVDDDSTTKPDIIDAISKKRSLTYLNAAVFDFGNTKNDLTYVGHFNIFAPDMTTGKRFGFNAGILKVNYRKNDSILNLGINSELLKRNYNDSLVIGQKYRRELNEYYTLTTNKDISLYFQPLLLLYNGKKSNNDIYFHLHSELNISTWNIETGYNTLFHDSIVYTHNQTGPLTPGPSFVYKLKNKNSYKETILSGVFGFGLTYHSKPFNNSSFFLQGTIGYSTTSLLVKDINPEFEINSTKTEKYLRGYSTRNWVYLIRSNYTHSINDNTQIILGIDARGYLPNFQPKFALFLGVNFSVEALGKLIGK